MKWKDDKFSELKESLFTLITLVNPEMDISKITFKDACDAIEAMFKTFEDKEII